MGHSAIVPTGSHWLAAWQGVGSESPRYLLWSAPGRAPALLTLPGQPQGLFGVDGEGLGWVSESLCRLKNGEKLGI